MPRLQKNVGLFSVLLGLLLSLWACSVAQAHTFGQVRQITAFSVEADRLVIRLDLKLDSGLLVFQPDRDGDGRLSMDEWVALMGKIVDKTTPNLRLAINGRAAHLEFQPPGDLSPDTRGLSYGASVTMVFSTPIPVDAGPEVRVEFRDENFAASGPKDRLDQYVHAAMSPRRVERGDAFYALRFSFPFDPDGMSSAGQALPGASAADTPSDTDTLINFVNNPDLSPWLLTLALATAFLMGALHSLSPGHGKAMVAAYLVGSQGRVRDAVLLGGVVSLTHTAGVFLLGGGLLLVSQYMDARSIHPWIGVASGALIFVIGYWMLARRALGSGAHDHDHHHDHGPGRDGVTGGSLLSLGVAGGMVPCPSAIVVLLAAVAVGRTGFGLALVLAFSLGLSMVLVGIGILTVTASRRLAALEERRGWIPRLPVVSAGLVMLAGVAVAFSSLLSGGVIRLVW